MGSIMKKLIKKRFFSHLILAVVLMAIVSTSTINFSQPVLSQFNQQTKKLFNEFQSILENKNNLDSFLIKSKIKKEDQEIEALPEYVPGQLIIKSKGPINSSETNPLGQKIIKQKQIKANFQLIEIDDKSLDMESFSRDYQKLPNIELAIPNYLFETTIVPNDSQYHNQWHHQSINSESAWDKQTGSPQTTIAIIDTGVDLDHQDLVGNLALDQAYDLVDIDTQAYINAGFELIDGEDYTDWDTQPEDINGHGTHVAGITAAQGNNQVGVTGVNWQTKIIPVRAGFSILWQGQEYGLFELDDLLYAMLYIETINPDIVNYSLGSETYVDLMEEFVNNIDQKGVLQIAAAGNNNSTTYFYPAALDKVLSVAGLDEADQKSSFSNYGDWVDLAVPGDNILSTYKDNQYAVMSGTSMSSPLVSGIAGLVISEHPDYSLDLIKYILTQAVEPVDFDLKYGKLMADLAVNLLEEDFTPEAITDLEIQQQEEDLLLEWSSIDLADSYNIYRSTEPYFTPTEAELIVNLTKTSYLDETEGITGDPETNYFYTVTAVNQTEFDLTFESDISDRVGEFDYLFSPGKYKLIAPPFTTLPFNNADELIQYFDPQIREVLKWNTISQTFYSWVPRINHGTNFLTVPGEVFVFQYCEERNNTIGTLTGLLPDQLNTLALGADYHLLPINLLYQDFTNAVELGNAFLPYIQKVYEHENTNYNQGKHISIEYIDGEWQGENFPIKPGYAYFIELNRSIEWKYNGDIFPGPRWDSPNDFNGNGELGYQIYEGEEFVLKTEVSDPDTPLENLEFEIIHQPDGGQFNSDTLEYKYTPTSSSESDAVDIRVSDGKSKDRLYFRLHSNPSTPSQ